ncbi:hypothetical protein OBK01_11740 [Empedobacter falsenii]
MKNKEFHSWLEKKNFFEYSKIQVESKGKDVIISLEYNETKGKLAFENYKNHKIVFKLEKVSEIITFKSLWNESEKQTNKIKIDIQMEDILTKTKGSDIFSIMPIENENAIIIENWFQDFRPIFIYEKVLIIKDEVVEKILEPKIKSDIFYFTYQSNKFPTSTYWIEKLEEEGIKASYIDYFNNPVEIQEVPLEDYSGWSIRPITLGELGLGAQVCIYNENEHLKTIKFDFIEQNLVDFIQKIKVIVSKSEVEFVKSGNVIFNKEQWENYIFENKLSEL